MSGVSDEQVEAAAEVIEFDLLESKQDRMDIARAVLEAVEPLTRERLADVWDECCKAVAWAMENSADLINAPHYAARNNPYRGQA